MYKVLFFVFLPVFLSAALVEEDPRPLSPLHIAVDHGAATYEAPSFSVTLTDFLYGLDQQGLLRSIFFRIGGRAMEMDLKLFHRLLPGLKGILPRGLELTLHILAENQTELESPVSLSELLSPDPAESGSPITDEEFASLEALAAAELGVFYQGS